MKGLAIWAHSVCRSTFALYRELGRQACVPVKIAVWKDSARGVCGMDADEFSDLDVVCVGEDRTKARQFLEVTRGWLQIFTTYQVNAAYRWAIGAAKTRGERLVAYAEAPSNMERGWRRFAKEIYLRAVLPRRCRTQIAAFGKLICASGNRFDRALQLGWPRAKVVPFGYAVPPLRQFSVSDKVAKGVLKILATGELTWHRGPDILVRALVELKRRGVAFEAVVTQEGPLKAALERMTRDAKLPVRFVGRVSLDDLTRLYRACDVFVAAGREEPWGMRVNDAINSGAPVIVSAGMGAAKMVEDTGCGCVVPPGDFRAIANCLERFADEPSFRSMLRSAVPCAASRYSVTAMARRFLQILPF